MILSICCVLVALCIVLAVLMLLYKATWKKLIRSPLNWLIGGFYKRITAKKDRPAVFTNHLKTFPWLNRLETNWESIRDELLSFIKEGPGLCNVHTTGGDELNKQSNWKLAMVLGYSKPVDEVKPFFPITLSILKTLPQVQNTAFSLLKAGGTIPPHRGSTASILRYHLALIVPDQGKTSWLTVDGVNVPWREGEGILFDDTFEHSARNGAKQDRVVLIVDIFRPNLGFVDTFVQKLEIWKRTEDFFAGRPS